MKNKYQELTIKTSRLLALVSSSQLQPLVDKYKADFSANKLHTVIFLKLFIYTWVFDGNDISLRTIAQYSHSPTFRQLAQLDDCFGVGKTALGNRLAKIPYQLFQELFEQLSQKTLTALPDGDKGNELTSRLLEQSHILDSTIITLSAKLLKAGYKINQGQLSVKASMAIHGRQIPIKALIFTEKTYSSEDKALVELFDFNQKDVIYLFDRGIQRLQTYVDIVQNKSHFISRLKAKKYTIVRENNIQEHEKETDTVLIIKDELIIFEQLKAKDQQYTFRLITALSKKDNNVLRFITSIHDINAADITELYRYRWSIEIFFRFLKREMHLESLMSYSENGIKVHIYLTLIASLLTWVFKERNQIKSFKRAREQLRWTLLDILMGCQFQEGYRLGASNRAFLDTS